MQRRAGWLFDLYPHGRQMILWFITDDGTRLRLVQDFAPSFFIDLQSIAPTAHDALLKSLNQIHGLMVIGKTERLDFWTDQPHSVLEIQITDLDHHHQSIQKLFRRWPGLTYYNCDIPPEIHYCYETGLFPTAYCTFTHIGDRMIACSTSEDPLATEYHLPEWRVIEISGEGVYLHPRPVIGSLTLTYEGQTRIWQDGPPSEMLDSLNHFLREIDPDLIWSTGGDSLLFPALFSLAGHYKMTLALDRESGIESRLMLDGHSYQSYGRVLYMAPDYPLFGRWHIDRENSFWGKETGLDGVIEVARLSKTTTQRTARRSSGTGISSIQLALAYRDYLIPWKKAQPEAWKSALMLLKADRGGMVYQPLTGLYEDVYELDFISMFPSIMTHHNVSSETVNCTCCPESHDVPCIGYTLCRKRKGLITQAVGPLVDKRDKYKRLLKDAEKSNDPGQKAMGRVWNHRQNAIKWLLVTCFGYLGYRNARFGRIEAHEATCAFSREKLMIAKEICEARGFEMLHAIVDCVWIRKSGTTENEINNLIAAIKQSTELKIAIEGHYQWLAFLPSRQDATAPVPNRFFGCMNNGKLKYRGIECRRSDQAPFIKAFQLTLLNRLAKAGSLTACRAARDELKLMVQEAEARLRCYEIPIDQLLLCRRLSMSPGEYQGPGMMAVAARQAKRAGMNLHAGESLWFLVTSARNRDPDSRLRLAWFLHPEDCYDADYYIEQLHRAAATILEPVLGENLDTLLGIQKQIKPRKNLHRSAIKREPASDANVEQLTLFIDLSAASS